MNGVLKLGFVPLADAAPLIAAQALGYFADEGLAVELVREVSWATIRDKVTVGAIDGAHMLSPLALGLGGEAGSVVAPFVLNRGGAAITLSLRIAAHGDPAAGLRRLVALRRAQGASPLTLAVVFPQSLHTLLLRRWLVDAQLDPERDVRITVAPPSRMADLLAEGAVEGFCAGEPWNAAAVAAGAGRVVARASALWPRAPDKVISLRGELAGRDAARVGAAIRALRRGADWAGSPANRAQLADLLSDPAHVGVKAEVLRRGLEEIQFCGTEVNAPRAADAVWLVGQMAQAGLLAPGSAAAAAALRTFRHDLYEAAVGASA